jgi:hypothetical protein
MREAGAPVGGEDFVSSGGSARLHPGPGRRRPGKGEERARIERIRTRCAPPDGFTASCDYRRNSGEMKDGRKSDTDGHMMTSASTSSIGISMIIVSLIASLILTPATEQAIMRHMP